MYPFFIRTSFVSSAKINSCRSFFVALSTFWAHKHHTQAMYLSEATYRKAMEDKDQEVFQLKRQLHDATMRLAGLFILIVNI